MDERTVRWIAFLFTSSKTSWKHLLFVIASIFFWHLSIWAHQPFQARSQNRPLCFSFALNETNNWHSKWSIVLMADLEVGYTSSLGTTMAAVFCLFCCCTLCAVCWGLNDFSGSLSTVAQSCDHKVGWASTFSEKGSRVKTKWIYIVSHLPHEQTNIRQESNIEEQEQISSGGTMNRTINC